MEGGGVFTRTGTMLKNLVQDRLKFLAQPPSISDEGIYPNRPFTAERQSYAEEDGRIEWRGRVGGDNADD